MQNGEGNSQQLLFPENISLSTEDMELVKGLMNEFQALGFDIRSFGKNDLIIHGAPVEAENQNITSIVEQLLEEFKNDQSALKNKPRLKLIQSLAKSMSIKTGKVLNTEEMTRMIDQLFACEMPYSNFDGKPIIVTYSLDELDKQFKRK
jgi:DNA mismatch repair protein MutL